MNLKKIKAKVFIGKENDVLDRFYRAAKKFNAKIIVRITADCPLIDSEMVDRCIKDFKSCVVFEGIPWSTDGVLNRSLEKAKKYDLRYALLRELFDVDTIKDFNKLGIEISDFEALRMELAI